MRFLKSIRFRLTVWYLVVVVVLLLVFSTAAYFMLSHNMYQNLDDSLKTRLAELRTTLSIEEGHAIVARQPDELLLIYNADGTLLQRFGPNTELAGIGGLVRQALNGQSILSSVSTGDGREVRLYAAPLTINFNLRLAIVVGRPTTEINNVLGTFRAILGASGLAVIILAGLGGWFLARRALMPVDRITRTAQEIGESDLSRRINVAGEDELGRLASTLNRMIERLEAAFYRQRQFVADASHELRTPLAVMQAESTLALDKSRASADYRKSLELISQEITYMSAMVNKLLFLARSDAGKEPLNVEEVNLDELLTGLSPDVEALGREKGLQFSIDSPEALIVNGDRIKLRQLFLNIMENAVRYTPSGGSISVSTVREKAMATVSISDTGSGIAAEQLPHLFERFYRVDKSRSREEGGYGLGLAIAKYIAEVHGGKIEVASEVGKGSTFRISIPLSRHDVVKGSSGSMREELNSED